MSQMPFEDIVTEQNSLQFEGDTKRFEHFKSHVNFVEHTAQVIECCRSLQLEGRQFNML